MTTLHSLISKVDRRALSGPAVKAFFNIAELWKLAPEEQMILLGLHATSTYYKWRKDLPALIPLDTLERISYILGIYKALQILLTSEQAADQWIRQPNSVFHGISALQRMLSGHVVDLYQVREYLDAQRGGWA